MYEKKKGMAKRSIVLGMVIAAVVLIAAIGSASAAQCGPNSIPYKAVCDCGDTVMGDYTLNGTMVCPAGSPGLTVGADGIVIDGAGFTITGNVAVANCAWATETSPSHECGILIDGHTRYNADVVIKNLEIEGFCTGIALHGAINPDYRIDNVTIDNCEIHDNGFDNGDSVTHGVHVCWVAEGAEGAPALTITNNEIYNNEGSGSGCGDGGNGIFIYGGSPCSTHEYCNISYNDLHHNAKAGFWTKMMLSKCDITHNKVTENGGGAGITDDVQGGIIFRCKHTSYNLVAYNNASNNGGGTNYGYGIYVGGYNNIIRDNDEGNETFGGDTCGVNGNTADGICMCRSDGADNNQIIHNTICSNQRYGVHAVGNTFNNSIYYNYICYNWQKDVWDDSDPTPYIELFGDYNNGTTAYQYCDYSAVDCPDVPFWGDCGLVGPDLTVRDKHETWDPPNQYSTYNITFTVTNAGNMQAGASNTRVWVNGVVQGTYPCELLYPGQSNTTTTGTINLASPPNPDTILVCADALGQVTETNENNNCTENKFGAADLQIILPGPGQYLVWTDLSWKTYELYYQVKNVGDRATPNDVWVNFTELHDEWKNCVNLVPIPAGLTGTTAMLTAGPFVMGGAENWVEEWVNFDYTCPVNYWNVLHHDRTRWTEGYPIPALGGVCWDVNGEVAKCGDVNLDGEVDPAGDAMRIKAWYNGIPVPIHCLWAADVTGDGEVDPAGDAMRIEAWYNGIPVPLNCCEGC